MSFMACFPQRNCPIKCQNLLSLFSRKMALDEMYKDINKNKKKSKRGEKVYVNSVQRHYADK